MKYFFLSLALCSVLACGNNTKNNPATNDSDTTNTAAAGGAATDAKATEAMLAGKWQS